MKIYFHTPSFRKRSIFSERGRTPRSLTEYGGGGASRSSALLDLRLEEGVDSRTVNLRERRGRRVAIREIVIRNRRGRDRLERGVLKRIKRRRTVELKRAVDRLRNMAVSRELNRNRYSFSSDINIGNLKGVRTVSFGDVEVEQICVRELPRRKPCRRTPQIYSCRQMMSASQFWR